MDTESYGLNYVSIVRDFQQHVLYGFFIGVLLAMANTCPDELDKFVQNCENGENGAAPVSMEVDNNNEEPAVKEAPVKETGAVPWIQNKLSQKQPQQQEASGKFVPLTEERVEFLLDMMRDIAAYVESKDFDVVAVAGGFVGKKFPKTAEPTARAMQRVDLSADCADHNTDRDSRLPCATQRLIGSAEIGRPMP